MPSSIKVAIVGLGYWGPNLLRNFFAASRCTVKYGCDLSQKNLDKMQRNFPTVTFTSSYDEVLNDPEVQLIAIATPTSAHFPLAKQALLKGKHVLIEKPVTPTSKEADELIAIARKNNLLIFVDHTFIYSPAVRKIAEIVKSGDLGELLYIESTRINLGLIQQDVNVLWDLAIHDLSIISTFVDMGTVTQVYAQGKNYHTKHPEIAHLNLTFASGLQAYIHVSWLSPVKLRQTIVGGSKKMILYDDTQLSEKVKIYDKGVNFEKLAVTGNTNPFFPVYRSGDVLIPALQNKEELGIEAEHILRCIEGTEKPLMAMETPRHLVRILECADESLRTGRSVDLSPAA